VIRIGGDFMGGRFLAAPFFVVVCVAVTLIPAKWPRLWVLPPVLVVLGLLSQHPNLAFGSHFAFDTDAISKDRVTDERKFYTNGTALRYAKDLASWPAHGWAQTGRNVRAAGREKVIERITIGMFGYFAGPDVFIVDPVGLGDPLLSRLPTLETTDVTVGHFRRRIPPGYIEGLKSGSMNLAEPGVAEFYSHIERITRGPLFTAERWRSIWLANTGGLRGLIPISDYRYAEARTVPEKRWSTPRRDGAPWNRRTITIKSHGACLVFSTLRTGSTIEMSADSNDAYTVQMIRGDEVVGVHTRRPHRRVGLFTTQFEVPPTVQTEGVDRICVFPGVGDGLHSVGHLILKP
ncbi:MAG: hypothetical protein AAFX99_03595, partial [Myxococcota bacterium]